MLKGNTNFSSITIDNIKGTVVLYIQVVETQKKEGIMKTAMQYDVYVAQDKIKAGQFDGTLYSAGNTAFKVRQLLTDLSDTDLKDLFDGSIIHSKLGYIWLEEAMRYSGAETPVAL